MLNEIFEKFQKQQRSFFASLGPIEKWTERDVYLSLKDAFPGIVCRELLPYGPKTKNPWSMPGSNVVAPGHNIPNKWEEPFANWIVKNLTSHLHDSSFDDLNIIFLGDSVSDAELINNVYRVIEKTTDVSFKNYLVNPALERSKFSERVNISDTWLDLDEFLTSAINNDPQSINVVICDLDQTFMFPRGISSDLRAMLFEETVINYLDKFFIGGIENHLRVDDLKIEIQTLRDAIKSNPEGMLHRNRGDKEHELLDILAVVTGLFDETEFHARPFGEKRKLKELAERCEQKRFGFETISKTSIRISKGDRLDRSFLQRHLINQRDMHFNRSSSINPLFRQIQEETTISFIEENDPGVFNAYIAKNMYKYYMNQENCIFLCHTDRPARSLGLRISSKDTLYCRDDKISLFETNAKVVF